MRFGLLHFQTLHQPAVLLRRQGSDFIFTSRPLVRALLQPLVEKNETVLLPVEALNAVSPPSTEQEQRIGEWVELELLLYHTGKTVNPFPQISISAGNIYPVCSAEIVQHDFKARHRASTILASAPS